MKIKNNITVYKCDHCSKKLFRKHAMEAHELSCSKNPKNIRACFSCMHLKSVEMRYEGNPQIFNDELRDGTCFKCTKKDIFLYPPKLEYNEKGVPEYTEYKGEEIEQERMPMTCLLREDEEYFYR